ncbi:Small acid-soluble spore protein SspA/SspB/SspC/SspD (alpha/beta-type), partial [Dysosmobacter welbionis]
GTHSHITSYPKISPHTGGIHEKSSRRNEKSYSWHCPAYNRVSHGQNSFPGRNYAENLISLPDHRSV